MKNLRTGRALAALLLLFSLLLFAVSCGETPVDPPKEHTVCIDTDEDGFCDECGKPVAPPKATDLTLIDEYETDYQLVIAGTAGASVKQKVRDYLASLEEEGVTLPRIDDYRQDKVTDKEILIGASVANRADYAIDVHELGGDGYAIRVIGEKVVVAGGSDSALAEAVDVFFEDFVLHKLSKKGNLTIAADYNDYHPQTDYSLTGITVGGLPITDFCICAAQTDELAYSLAQNLRETVYQQSGIWLPLYKTEQAHNVIVRTTNDAGEEGFRAYLLDGDFVIECSYKNAFKQAFADFLTLQIKGREGELKFDTGYNYTDNVAVVTYEDFGAKGDGITDDLEAIVAAHNFANAGGQTVKGKPGATYYIARTDVSVLIQTDVDWTGSNFIIDDRGITLETGYHHIFNIEPSYSKVPITLPEGFTLEKGATNFGMTFDYDLFIIVEDENHMVYKRKTGDDATNVQLGGIAASDPLLVDRDGNIDPSTPVFWGYPEGITKITAWRVDEKPITVKGGDFTTICNTLTINQGMAYANRNFRIRRSNTTLDAVNHHVTGEVENPIESTTGVPYMGFYFYELCTHIVMKNCGVTGRVRIYGGSNYEIATKNCNDVLYYGCYHFDEITDMTKWGDFVSNGCKNLVVDHSSLSRFDAHRGLVNAKVVDSEIGMIVNLIGGGDFLIQNTKLYLADNGAILTLRGDYGCTWDGDITIKDCEMLPTDRSKVWLFKVWWYDFDHGQVCYFGRNILVDGVTLPDNVRLSFVADILGSYSGEPIEDIRKHPRHPFYMPEKVVVKNVSGANREIQLADSDRVCDLFKYTDYDDKVLIRY